MDTPAVTGVQAATLASLHASPAGAPRSSPSACVFCRAHTLSLFLPLPLGPPSLPSLIAAPSLHALVRTHAT